MRTSWPRRDSKKKPSFWVLYGKRLSHGITISPKTDGAPFPRHFPFRARLPCPIMSGTVTSESTLQAVSLLHRRFKVPRALACALSVFSGASLHPIRFADNFVKEGGLLVE